MLRALSIYIISVVVYWILARYEMKYRNTKPDGYDLFLMFCPILNTVSSFFLSVVILIKYIDISEIARVVFLMPNKKEEQ